jgi:hypothetical protein
MNLRAEIQYALAQTRWLAMEGTRCQTIGDLCEDTVFIARKLCYDWVHIGLEDDERTWRIRPVNGNELHLFRHKLPGHRDCFIELGVSCPKKSGGMKLPRAKGRQKFCESCLKMKSITLPNGNGASVHKDCGILCDLLAEGWTKAIAAWEKQNQLPVRFNVCLTPVPEKKSEKNPALQTAMA